MAIKYVRKHAGTGRQVQHRLYWWRCILKRCSFSPSSFLVTSVAYPFADPPRFSPSFLSRFSARHSSTSFVGSRRIPHSRNTLRMSSAHRCTAVFSWSFSFCRTVACTPSRPRTQGTDMYTSLSVPWEQLCERRFLELVRRVNQHANKCVSLSELCLTRKGSRKDRHDLKSVKYKKICIN